MTQTPADLKAEILRLAKDFSRLAHTANRPGYETPGEVQRPPNDRSLRRPGL
jgi:hypothetical protein